MFSARPLVDYTISHPILIRVPEQLDFRGGPEQIKFRVRNRGGTDAPIFVNITVVNAYISDKWLGPFNQSSPIVFATSLDAHSEYDGWTYFIVPLKDVAFVGIEFSVTKRLRLDISGITNWLFGEYNGYCVSLTYVQQSPGLYVLRR